MNKKVLVLSGSPRKHGNTDRLADEFIRGAAEMGHETRKICLRDQTVHGCLGCGACQRNGGTCIQKDDMPAIYAAIKEADVIVLASPVYFYTWTAQMKTALDRCFALEQHLTNKTFYLICAGAAPAPDYFQTIQTCFEQYVQCFRAGGNTIGGSVFGLGASAPGDIVGTAAMEQAYQLARQI